MVDLVENMIEDVFRCCESRPSRCVEQKKGRKAVGGTNIWG